MSNNYILRFNPITPSQRHTCLVNKRNLSNNMHIKRLCLSLKNSAGRNNSGIITVRHKGAGVKKKFRKIDFKRNIYNIPAEVYTIEYDPYRSSFVSLIHYSNGLFCYILTTQFNLCKKIFIYNYNERIAFHNIGDSNLLLYFDNGTLLHNLEQFPGKGGSISRSAGTYSLLVNVSSNTSKVKLPSGKILLLSSYCRATLGIVSNQWYRYLNLGKAGRSRWLGIRPSVRGVAMNPIDHPHGGGEGKKTGRVSPFTVWGRRQKTVS
ncbi:50S ribosomal protein L2 [compost metagenome]